MPPKNQKERASFINYLIEGLEHIDLFGVPIQLNFNGRDLIHTWPGFLMSILIHILFITYASKKGMNLIFRYNPVITEWTQKNYFDSNSKLDLKKINFKIAFGVIDYNTYEVKNNPDFV